VGDAFDIDVEKIIIVNWMLCKIVSQNLSMAKLALLIHVAFLLVVEDLVITTTLQQP
jgi:hypothetical protein